MTIRTLLLATLFCCVGFTVFAQRRHSSILKPGIKYEDMSYFWQQVTQSSTLGLQYGFIGINVDANYTASRNGNGANVDTSLKLSKGNNFSLGFIAGNAFLLKRMERSGRLELDVAFSYMHYKWNMGAVPVPEDPASTIKYIRHDYSIPLTLYYRRGAEAERDINMKYMYSLGCGVDAGRVKMEFNANTTLAHKLAPFVAAEGGIYAGRAMKLRMVYYPLSSSVYSVNGGFSQGKLNNTITNSGSISVSYILMLYSKYWGE